MSYRNIASIGIFGYALLTLSCSSDVSPPAPSPAPTPSPVAPPPQRGLTVFSADSVMSPKVPFTIRGVGLEGAAVVVDSTTVSMLVATDTLIEVSPPDSLFLPCVGPNRQLNIRITSEHGATSLVAHAQEEPLRVSLAVGQYFLASAAVQHGCRIMFSQSGEYLAVPFRPERPSAAHDTSHVTIHVVLGSQSAVSSSAANHAASVPAMQTGGAPVQGHKSRIFDVILPNQLRTSVAALATRQSSDVASIGPCPLPSAVGDSVPFHTYRLPDGSIDFSSQATERTEYWRLVALSSRLAVFFDSTSVRISRADTALANRLTTLVADYDTVVAPVYDRYYPPMPDLDGNGHLIVFIDVAPAVGPAGLALAANNLRSDCSAPGDGVLLYLARDLWVNGSDAAWSTLDLAHEAAHVIDFSPPQRGAHTLDNSMATEGFAQFTELLVLTQRFPDPLGANFGDYVWFKRNGGGAGIICAPDKPEPAIAFSWMTYDDGCLRVGYAVDEGMREAGITLKDAIHRYLWGKASTLADLRNAVSGQNVSAAQVDAEWYLSWYADDRVANTIPTLQNRTWDLPAVLFTPFFASTVKLVDGSFAASASEDFVMQQADPRFLLLTVATPSTTPLMVTTSSSTSLVSPPVELALLRTH